MRAIRWTVPVAVLAACGPSAGSSGDDTTSSTTATSSATVTSDNDTPATTQPQTTTPGTVTTVADTGPMTSTESADSLDSNSFLDTFGDGGVAVQCDIWAQDCPDGEKCVPYSYDGRADWNGALCVPIVKEPGAPGDACMVADDPFSGFDDCTDGSICWGADDAKLAGVCYSQCTGSRIEPQCGDGLDCWHGSDVVAVCVSTCLPLEPACAAHESCVVHVPTRSAFCIPTPLVMGTEYGEACDVDALACGTGLACVEPDDVPSCIDECCTTLCEFSSPTECPDAAQTCRALFDRAPPGFENLGYCGIAV